MSKIIHQSWKSRHLPQRFEPFVKSWLVLNPDWEYILWTDADCESFMEEYFPSYVDMCVAADFAATGYARASECVHLGSVVFTAHVMPCQVPQLRDRHPARRRVPLLCFVCLWRNLHRP